MKQKESISEIRFHTGLLFAILRQTQDLSISSVNIPISKVFVGKASTLNEQGIQSRRTKSSLIRISRVFWGRAVSGNREVIKLLKRYLDPEPNLLLQLKKDSIHLSNFSLCQGVQL